MRYHELKESVVASELILRQAAEDFIHDWREIDPSDEDREPLVRRRLIQAMRKQGLDADAEGAQDALMPMMAAEARRFIASLPWHGGKLVVYRNIIAPDGWEADPSRRALGVYWAADDHYSNGLTMGRNGSLTTIVSEVRPNQIDWDTVILQHLTYTENEIRIKNNETVPILRVYTWEHGAAVERDITHLKGKLFSVGRHAD